MSSSPEHISRAPFLWAVLPAPQCAGDGCGGADVWPVSAAIGRFWSRKDGTNGRRRQLRSVGGGVGPCYHCTTESEALLVENTRTTSHLSDETLLKTLEFLRFFSLVCKVIVLS